MSCFRFLLACLLMLTVPVQALGTASMVVCTGATGHQEHQVHLKADAAEEANSRLGAPQNQLNYHIARGGRTKQSIQQMQSTGAAKLRAKAPPDATHSCSMCSVCCHLAAVPGMTLSVPNMSPPQADLIEPSALMQTRFEVVPDKPPRT